MNANGERKIFQSNILDLNLTRKVLVKRTKKPKLNSRNKQF